MSDFTIDNPLYCDSDLNREGEENPDMFLTSFRSDLSRLVHCPAFRRMQNKTQLIPNLQSDFYRNRLTHSIEVAQIAKNIAQKLNKYLKAQHWRENQTPEIDLDLVEFAGLAHDLGHPPFGHTGEIALNNAMREHGGFEGNAQTLRILTRLEKKFTANMGFKEYEDGKDNKLGLNLTYRTLASIIKYDRIIPVNGTSETGFTKGYYKTEEDLVAKIKKNIYHSNNEEQKSIKTIEMQIMDIADDIAYSTYDLEDAFKSGMTSPIDIWHRLDTEPGLLDSLSLQMFWSEDGRKNPKETLTEDEKNKLKAHRKKVLKTARAVFTEMVQTPNEIFNTYSHSVFKKFSDLINDGLHFDKAYKEIGKQINELALVGALAIIAQSDLLTKNGYLRTKFTSAMIQKRINAVTIEYDKDNPCFSKIKVDEDTRYEIEVIKHLNFEMNIKSPKLKLNESRGKKIIDEIFEVLINNKNGELLPYDWRSRMNAVKGNHYASNDQHRVICDFIAGMTDSYAEKFHSCVVLGHSTEYLDI